VIFEPAEYKKQAAEEKLNLLLPPVYTYIPDFRISGYELLVEKKVSQSQADEDNSGYYPDPFNFIN